MSPLIQHNLKIRDTDLAILLDVKIIIRERKLSNFPQQNRKCKFKSVRLFSIAQNH